ncbi:MAG: hypothetical protein ACFB00_11665 [Parvularculaceae bacterium]
MTPTNAKIALCAAAAGLAGLVAAANAQPGPHGNAELDADGDGEVTVQEIVDRASERANAIDANNDGVVSDAEREADREARRAERRARIDARRFPDANGDDVVDRGEWQAAALERFDRLDENADGVLTRDEAPKGRKHGRRGHRGGGRDG